MNGLVWRDQKKPSEIAFTFLRMALVITSTNDKNTLDSY